MSQKRNYFHGGIFIFITYLLFSIRKRKTRVSGVWSVWNLLTIASGYRDQREIFTLSSEEQSVFLSCSVACNCKPGVTLGKWRYLITKKKRESMVCRVSTAGLGAVYMHEGQLLRSGVINKLNFSDSILTSFKIYFLKVPCLRGLFQQLSTVWIWNVLTGFPGNSVVKNLPANEGDTGLIPGLGRSLGRGKGNPLQCSCLGNPMDSVLAGYSP